MGCESDGWTLTTTACDKSHRRGKEMVCELARGGNEKSTSWTVVRAGLRTHGNRVKILDSDDRRNEGFVPLKTKWIIKTTRGNCLKLV